MNVVLVSTYDLGRQPFGLASPAAWLRGAGHTVACADLSVGTLPISEVREADLIAFYVPMHTATRLAVEQIGRVRALNARARLCAFGLYAPLNADLLQSHGVHTIIGGEFEQALVTLAGGTEPSRTVHLDRLAFVPPDRAGLPVLARYPKLVLNGTRLRAGYTEASRGCKHLCRHCPVVPVYNGTFRIVQPEVVLEDVRRQVDAGAQHISFGDPDFFNGPTHASRIVTALHEQFPALTYDVTIKIEHLLKHREQVRTLAETGCLFVISAVESVQDEVLRKLDKGHTLADFIEAASMLRDFDLTLAPTFIPITPWTTLDGYRELLETIAGLDLIDNVAPVQLSLRLLIPAHSRLLELEEVRSAVTAYDADALVWRWVHADPAVDDLAREVLRIVREGTKAGKDRRRTFSEIWQAAHERPPAIDFSLLPRTVIPYMEEPWFC